MTRVPATCELWVDGVRYADGATGVSRAPVALTDLRLIWGRDNRVDQPQPAQLAVKILDRGAGTHWDQTIGLGSAVTIWAAVDGQRVSPFTGRVTDVTAEYDEDMGGTVVQVAAADQLADLANRYVGDEPWAAELYWQRAVRITGGDQTKWAPIPWPPGGTTVSRMDVDRQAAAGLLATLALSGGTIAFPAMFPDGKELWVSQNPNERASVTVLGVGGDGLWRPIPGVGLGAYALSACDVLRDPIRWARTSADLVTRVTIRWLDQTTTPDTTERSVGYVNAADETRWGARGISLGTILTTAADADLLAVATLVRNQASEAYRAAGLVWDLDRVSGDPVPAGHLAARLLDSSVRTGTALLLTDLPDWTPASAEVGGYVEGGTYSFSDGRWVLSLSTTSAVGAGTSISYAATPRPAPAYNQFAADVSYLDLVGVGPPATVGELPAGERPGAGLLSVMDPAGVTTGGLPYPEPTAPYKDTPAALKALGDAITPKLLNLPVQWINARAISGDSNGDCLVDLRATFTSITGAVVSDCNGVSGTPCNYQIVYVASDAPGILRIRVLNTGPPDGGVWANPTTWVCIAVWGTPK